MTTYHNILKYVLDMEWTVEEIAAHLKVSRKEVNKVWADCYGAPWVFHKDYQAAA